MLFEKAIPKLLKALQNEYSYATEDWARMKLEEYFEKSAGMSNKDSPCYLIVNKFVNEHCVEAPTSDILRLTIMQYTFGYFCRDIVYANRFRNNPEECKAYKGEHTKLLFANALIQWKLMCEQLGYNWEEVLALGQEHLEERYKDFNQDGWAKL